MQNWGYFKMGKEAADVFQTSMRDEINKGSLLRNRGVGKNTGCHGGMHMEKKIK